MIKNEEEKKILAQYCDEGRFFGLIYTGEKIVITCLIITISYYNFCFKSEDSW